MLNRVKLIAINLIVLLIFLEIISLGLYAYKRGDLFYSRDIAQNLESVGGTGDGVLGGNFFKRLNLMLHPYFGYVERVEEGKTNNHGVRHANTSETCCGFPYDVSENTMVLNSIGTTSLLTLHRLAGVWLRYIYIINSYYCPVESLRKVT